MLVAVTSWEDQYDKICVSWKIDGAIGNNPGGSFDIQSEWVPYSAHLHRHEQHEMPAAEPGTGALLGELA